MGALTARHKPKQEPRNLSTQYTGYFILALSNGFVDDPPKLMAAFIHPLLTLAAMSGFVVINMEEEALIARRHPDPRICVH